MTTNRRNTSTYDANRRLPEGWTNELIQDVKLLSGDPKKFGYLQQQFLTKFVSSETAPASVRRTAAINKWLATERNNEATNDRIEITHGDYNILPRVSYESFVAKARQFTFAIVGEMPDDADLIGGFSGGASTSRRRTESNPASKYLGQADVTEDALPLFIDAMSMMPGWASSVGHLERPVIWTESMSEIEQLRYSTTDMHFVPGELSFRSVPGNVMFTVPKSTDIDRCACKEPDINMFLQRGLGSRIRRDLRRVGIDLNDQSRNRNLACEGSRTGELATLDLSSASDSVTTGLVELLMPTLWFTILNAVRSKVTLIDGEEHRNEMFSSMGNGFTFELESLLFYVLARTTAYFRGISGVISVYGDDIIVPTSLAQDLMWVLSFFGFSVNTDKSYWTGDFRESCGGHYVSGRDITPFYLRAPMERLTDLIHMVNSIRLWSKGDLFEQCDPTIYDLWSKWKDRVPQSLWGGREYSSITQLVSPDVPKACLTPRLHVKDTGMGGYIHWLSSTRDRQILTEAIETSKLSTVIHRYRPVKRRRTVTWLADYFPQEIICDTECGQP